MASTKQVLNMVPVTYLTELGEGLSREERRKRLAEQFESLEQNVGKLKSKISSTKENIEDVRSKHENMNDLVLTMEQLKTSLEEHIRTVRLNEGSFAGTTAVLEYDNAKERTKTLINVIKALSRLNRAREALKDSGEDQKRMYEALVDMQESQKILKQYVSSGFDDKVVEDLKDKFLAWQSTALIFAIQQADFNKLLEIQKTYELLNRKDEFISIFHRVSINRMKDFKYDNSTIQALLDGLQKEMEFIYTHHHKILRRFLSEQESSELINSAIAEGLQAIDLSTILTNLISENENPIELVQKIVKILNVSASQPEMEQMKNILKTRIRKEVASPLKSALTTFLLARVNTIELTTGSFRARMESLKSAIAEILSMLHDVVIECEVLMEDKLKDVVQQPIDTSLDNFMVKIRALEYKTDSQKQARSLEDVMAVCSASGQLIFGLQQFKSLLETIDPSLSPNTKSVQKWNRNVVDAVLKCACDSITTKMIAKIQTIKSTPVAPNAAGSRLPSFSTAPHEYITTVGQELLQVFHRWEQFFLDDNISHAFFIAFKKRFEGDDLFKKTIADVSSKVISEFIKAIGDTKTLQYDIAKQFLADTGFLKDAFDDLRAGNTDELAELEEKLKKQTKT